MMMSPVARTSPEPKLQVTMVEVMQAKMCADFMFNEILSHLEDVEATIQGIKIILHSLVRHPIIEKFVTGFFKKLDMDPSHATRCSDFKKRILLFSIVEYVVTGEDLAIRFSPKGATPLEAVMHRLGDLAVAFESVLNTKKDQEEFVTNIWLQTLKQAILLFLKSGQFAKASEILILHREKLITKQQKTLEKLIRRCSNSKTALDALLAKPGHSYRTYYATMSAFISGLNAKLEKTTLALFAQTVSSAQDARGGSESVVSDSEFDDEVENKALEGQQPADNESAAESRVFDAESRIDVDDDASVEMEGDILSPKISLSYRLKKQSHTSGIIIPCKSVVDHCRKANNEEDWSTECGFSGATASTLKKSAAQKRNRPRNYLLGERFDDLNGPAQPLCGRRSYRGDKNRTVYTLEHDSYIATGCRHIGIGHWKEILDAFPFPSTCTSTKIKDRFRTLINMKYIALLDDMDFTVLHKELKSKLPKAEEIMKSLRKQTKKRSEQKHYDTCSASSKPGRKRIENTASLEKPEKRSSDDILSASAGSGEGASDVTLQRWKAFLPMEDAYLLCGVKNFGMRWAAIKEYMNFRPGITVDDMQKRWGSMIESGDVEPARRGGYICHDDNLLRACNQVMETLKEKIRSERRRFGDAAEEAELDSNGTVHSVSAVASSEVIPVGFQRKRKQRLALDSSEDIVDESECDDTEQRSKTNTHNVSVDAETQTPKRKFTLKDQSPSILDAESSSDDNDKSVPNLPTGSTIRPSMINLFKRTGKARNKSRKESQVTELREKRQREIARVQRRNKAPPAKRKAWSAVEVKKLLELFPVYGPGKWSDILDAGYDVLQGRTSMMIKDKFRNLLKSGMITEEDVEMWKANASGNQR